MHATDAARAACEGYERISTTGRAQGTLFRNKFSVVGSWLEGVAKAAPVFDLSKPYVKVLERSSLSNAVELGKWDTWIASVQGECQKALNWLADASPKGPMVHFERAVAVTKEALVDPN